MAGLAAHQPAHGLRAHIMQRLTPVSYAPPWSALRTEVGGRHHICVLNMQHKQRLSKAARFGAHQAGASDAPSNLRSPENTRRAYRLPRRRRPKSDPRSVRGAGFQPIPGREPCPPRRACRVEEIWISLLTQKSILKVVLCEAAARGTTRESPHTHADEAGSGRFGGGGGRRGFVDCLWRVELWRF